MAQLEMVLPSFPVVVPVEKKMVPKVVKLLEPDIVQLVMVLLLASAINLMVEVPAVADAVVLEMVNELPPVFNPSMVTLSAPFKLINGLPAVVAPVMVLAPFGVMVIEVHAPALSAAVAASSSVLAVIEIPMVAPVCAPPLMAVKAAPSVA